MSKSTKKYGWLTSRPNSAKTIVERAKREVPDFIAHYAKFGQQAVIGGYSSSTVFNYSRAVAKISLHFKKSVLDLDPEEVNQFLFLLAREKKASSTYFKHTVYGLRFFFRLYGLEDRALRLPTVKNDIKLPVVLSAAELKRLFSAPQRLKHRVLLALIYSAGLQVSEVCNLKIGDIDSDRERIRVVKSKGKQDRYVPLSSYILCGLRKYVKSSRPKEYLFKAREKG
jgi:site-specific recombinase XerD